ncbi:bifunctional 4-hydroxy-2-oxoglutarate aldolase/2-dehydro-3-deoxy-phosphogluconate aldolase [Acidothermaceae bacterium B102]|nr:bifunctional 4-hydroxy-2-oxoglutarate aldolase/2-dehydro-3-deoxy-phosphogluconate aldolase [Acidothermaceae bacterium B102]
MTQRLSLPPSLVETRLMAILRAPDAATLEPVAVALAAAGVRCLEVAMTGTGALDVVRRLRTLLSPDVSVGAGSVIAADQAHAAVDAGAEFLVSPSTDADVIAIALAAGVGAYPGAWTANEVVRAWQLGATAVKLFPASSGGPEHLRQLAAPLPQIPLIAVGGVSVDNAAAFVAAGAVAVGIGSGLLRDVDPADQEAVTARVRELLTAVRAPT